MASAFRDRVFELVRRIPRGRVSTYSEVAHACGSSRAARQVGWSLSDLPAGVDIPWWRVIKSSGLVPSHKCRDLQVELLRAEGLEVDEAGRVDLRRWLWDELG
jgi:methylated-DNA-protein-cysteine methyltransferase-like protein